MSDVSDPTPDPNTPGLSATAVRLIEAVTHLGESVGRLDERIADISKARRHDRVMLVILSAVMAVVLLVSVGTVYAVVEARNATQAICESANESRARQVELWDFVVNLSGPTDDPEETRQVNEFQAYVRETFRQRQC